MKFFIVIVALSWFSNMYHKTFTQTAAEDWRLFSAGLHGLVIEHKLGLDLSHADDDDEESYRSTSRTSWPVTSGAAWCMKFNEVINKLFSLHQISIYESFPPRLNLFSV